MASMEYRLLQIHWEGASCDCPNAENENWHFTSASEDGIVISAVPIPYQPEQFWNMGPKTYAFLAETLGKGGRWEGWDLHAFSQIACPEDNILNMILVRELDEETEEQTEGETKRETEIDWSVL